ncbi:MAG TPA: VTT domain-containing protein [Candidatus Saccharimonadales bacterium]|nr:VTT domain-containing protein [Candidatus Saccharimonadales bacterium]
MKQSLYALSFLLSIGLIYLAFVFHGQLGQFHSWGIFGIFLINLFGSATLFVPAPAIATVIAGGAVYSPLLVAPAAAIGASLGDSLGFFLGNSGTHLVVKKGEAYWYNLLKKNFKKFGGLIIFLFAFIPNPFFDGIGILAGVSGYSFVRFFTIMLLGRLARDILLASLGARL